jgi:hydroxymethylpyrimidine/phosphomethylpyrimidine kinase
MHTPPVALAIAGTDSGGGAGASADTRTLFACGVHPCLAVTAVTVQNTVGVRGFTAVPAGAVADQIAAVATDIGIDAAKTGMLASAEIITAVAEACERAGIGSGGQGPLVVDPVAASMHGDPLLAPEALDALRERLFPMATVITPNLDEVALLTGTKPAAQDQLRSAALELHAMGPDCVLVKAGHLNGEARCVDVFYDGREFTELPSERVATEHTHGGGDTMASAITAGLARGMPTGAAVRYGKWFVTRAVRGAYPLGAGAGPVSQFWRLAPE